MPNTDPRLTFQRGRWVIAHEGARFSTGTTDRLEAEAFLENYKAGLNKSVSLTSTANMLEKYLETREGKPGRERLMWAHKQLVRHLGDRLPEHLKKVDFDQYIRLRLADGVMPGTARIELAALRAALRWHLGQAAPKVAMPAKPAPKDRWLTRDEADRLLAACKHTHVRLFVILALHTAARAGAILSLEWSQVDLERRRIDYRKPNEVSTHKRRVPVTINEVLLAELTAARERSAGRYVIEFGGDRIASVRKGVLTAAAKAGLRDVTPHVFRHTAATWMAQAGVPIWNIAGVLGHTDANMIAKVYAHHSPDYLRTATDALAGKPLEQPAPV